jgi:hypothetical protein
MNAIPFGTRRPVPIATRRGEAYGVAGSPMPSWLAKRPTPRPFIAQDQSLTALMPFCKKLRNNYMHCEQMKSLY